MTLNPFHGTGLFLCPPHPHPPPHPPTKLVTYIFKKCQQNVDIHACSITAHFLIVDLQSFFQCTQKV